MTEAPLSPDEPFRLQALRRANQLDTALDERFERITRLTQRLLETPIAAISLVDADRQWFKSIQGSNITETSRKVAFCNHTILRDEVLVVSDARTDPRFSDNPLVSGAPNIVFYAGCPIRTADGSKIGALCVIDHKPRSLSPEDIQTLSDLAAIAELEFSAAVHSATQKKVLAELDSISRLAKVDSLTRIWNRESIFKLLDMELSRAQSAATGIGVLMADLDQFKQVNDTRGHAAGDEVLRQTAKRILGSIREIDALGRYGGEEFMIVLGPCNGLAEAELIAERIQKRISAELFATEFGQLSVTISLGATFCQFALHATAQTLVRTADAALYRAKLGGRNRVESILIVSEPGDLKEAS